MATSDRPSTPSRAHPPAGSVSPPPGATQPAPVAASPHAAETRKPPLKQRLQALLVEYGKLALWVYLVIFGVVLIGFAMAIQLGVEVGGAGATAGTWVAAWLATKLTQPLRIAATLLLTPVVMRLLPGKGRTGRDDPAARA